VCCLTAPMRRDPYRRAMNPTGATRRPAALVSRHGSVLVEGVAGAVMALAAAGCNPQCELQFVEAGATLTGDPRDVAVGDSVADKNDHALTVMRMIRISKKK